MSEASCLFWFLPLRHDVVSNIFALENLCGGVDSKTEPLILIQSHVRGECSDVAALRMKLQLVVSRFEVELAEGSRAIEVCYELIDSWADVSRHQDGMSTQSRISFGILDLDGITIQDTHSISPETQYYLLAIASVFQQIP